MVLRNGSALSVDGGMAAEAGDGEQPSTSQPIRVSELDQFDEAWVKPFPLKDGVHIRKGEKFSDYYTLYEEIGEGKFGKVYRCVEKATGLVLAAKCIKIRKDTDFEKVEKEVKVMTQMRHKCIAQIYDAFATGDNDVILIMEMVQGGELFDRIADDTYILTEMAVALIMFQIIEAIRYIHSQNIIHLDLKPENIMCVSQTSNKVKLIDFGLAQWYDGSKDLMFMAGTPEFAAPEVIKYEPLDFHTDMWSLGVIAYILLSGQSPFLGETLAHTYCNVEKGRWMFCEEFTDNGISAEAKDFISRLLIVEKEKRMMPDECLAHEWLVKNRQRALINASRAVSPAVCQPLAVDKLRSYVKNKRFRRLVFGVLFVNSVMRMLRTLQKNKSAHGIEYVRAMLAAAEAEQPPNEEATESNLLLRAFTKKKTKVATAVCDAIVEAKPKEELMEEQKMETERTPKEPMAPEAGKAKKRVVLKKVREPGEKKKRSKSEARRAAEQQRTHSSSEHTSNKKQRQEAEEKMELDNKKKELDRRKEEEKPMMMRVIKMEVAERKPIEKVIKEKSEADERNRRQEQRENNEKPSPKLSKVQKLAQRMEQQKRMGEHVPEVASTSAAPKPIAINNSLVSNMLKKLKTQEQSQQGAAPLLPMAFAVSATAPHRKEELKEQEQKKKKVVMEEEVGKRKEELISWREEIRLREEADKQRGDEKKKLVKVKRKVVRRVRTADEEMKERKTAVEARKECNGKARDEQHGMRKKKTVMEEQKMEVDNNDNGGWVGLVVVERTRERLRKEAEEQKAEEEAKKKFALGRRKEAALNGMKEMKPQLNGHGGGQLQRAKPRLKVSNSLEEMAINVAHDDAGWAMVGQDVFDFSLLRMKLQNRIMGLKDKDELATEAENRQKFELQKQQRELQTNLNIKRAMRKWVTMDKESRHPTGPRARGHPEQIPDWAR